MQRHIDRINAFISMHVYPTIKPYLCNIVTLIAEFETFITTNKAEAIDVSNYNTIPAFISRKMADLALKYSLRIASEVDAGEIMILPVICKTDADVST